MLFNFQCCTEQKRRKLSEPTGYLDKYKQHSKGSGRRRDNTTYRHHKYQCNITRCRLTKSQMIIFCFHILYSSTTPSFVQQNYDRTTAFKEEWLCKKLLYIKQANTCLQKDQNKQNGRNTFQRAGGCTRIVRYNVSSFPPAVSLYDDSLPLPAAL